jgi:lysophospholipase L1-like esterase
VNKVPLEEYKQNIHILLAAAQKHTKRIVIVGLTKVDEAANLSPSRFLNSQIEIYNSFLKEFSESNTLPFIDVYETLDTTTDLCDGLHPNAQGYEKLSRVILEVIV